MSLVFFVVQLLGKEENEITTQNESILLRLLTPLTKAYTAKLCYNAIAECAEALGGLGYIENQDVLLNVSRLVINI